MIIPQKLASSMNSWMCHRKALAMDWKWLHCFKWTIRFLGIMWLNTPFLQWHRFSNHKLNNQWPRSKKSTKGNQRNLGTLLCTDNPLKICLSKTIITTIMLSKTRSNWMLPLSLRSTTSNYLCLTKIGTQGSSRSTWIVARTVTTIQLQPGMKK